MGLCGRPAESGLALAELAGDWRGIDVHVVEGVLDGNEVGYDFVGLEDLRAPDSAGEGSGSHPKVVLESVLVGNFSPEADLSTQDSGLVDSCRENNQVFVDLSPVAVVALSAIEPKVAHSFVDIENVRGREDDLALGIGGD